MEFHWIWKGILIILFGSIILRIAGRKSISQMTVAQTVIMISIGTLLIQPVSEKSIWITFLICSLLIFTLIVVEFVQLKSDKMERFFSGHAVVIVENGNIKKENLKRLRLPVDKLEMRLRQKNIQRMEDVLWATVETNGEIGYMLKPELQCATKKDIQTVIELIEKKMPIPAVYEQVVQPEKPDNIFKEVSTGKNVKYVPDDLK
ncbi:hypothetical protein CR203_08590 [Salipaludibacillus neizhouensis]|uniref:YetF C-terminal domain-containing protein n=1 Tax=Salipaludibacillus neizhouensis TaxID=885475 RepID=A0A3A9K9A9_9BACI|nr:DUF421 domain-containing protein [Salipaludibacillus neizhouensis]RKL67410.1 hypothetical protein CR203_08590 [Salipaludibacillus neizhouensis]